MSVKGNPGKERHRWGQVQRPWNPCGVPWHGVGGEYQRYSTHLELFSLVGLISNFKSFENFSPSAPQFLEPCHDSGTKGLMPDLGQLEKPGG